MAARAVPTFHASERVVANRPSQWRAIACADWSPGPMAGTRWSRPLQDLADATHNERDRQQPDRPCRGRGSEPDDPPRADPHGDEQPGWCGDQAQLREPMPARIRGPWASVALDSRPVQEQGFGACELKDGPDPRQEIRTDAVAEGDERCPGKDAQMAAVALGRRRIRAPATVGARSTSDAATASTTNPKTLSHAWAGFSMAHPAITGAHPAGMAVASATPTPTWASATPYARKTSRSRAPRAARKRQECRQGKREHPDEIGGAARRHYDGHRTVHADRRQDRTPANHCDRPDPHRGSGGCHLRQRGRKEWQHGGDGRTRSAGHGRGGAATRLPPRTRRGSRSGHPLRAGRPRRAPRRT